MSGRSNLDKSRYKVNWGFGTPVEITARAAREDEVGAGEFWEAIFISKKSKFFFFHNENC